MQEKDMGHICPIGRSGVNNNVLNNNYVKLDTWSDQTHSKIKVI